MRIFACDDEPLVLRLLETAIREVEPEAKLYSFGNPAELLEFSQTQEAEVAFLDIRMPEINGLELAKELTKRNPQINIVFVTGYSEYTGEAFNLFASGYVQKPVDAAQIRQQLSHLRYPIVPKTQYFAQTFGFFTLFANGKPITFSLKKSQEILAFLVDRNGSVVSRRELAMYVFEDDTFSRQVQRSLSNALHSMMEVLEKYDAAELVFHTTGGYSINKELLQSDLFDFLSNKSKEAYHGEYMEQYSWGEYFKGNH